MSAKLARAVRSDAHFVRMIALHAAGGALGGLLLGITLALVALLVAGYQTIALLTLLYVWVTALSMIVRRGGLTGPVLSELERPAQVSGRYVMPQAAGIWGLQLGLGVFTFIVTPVFHIFLVSATYLGVFGALAAGVLYGLGRSLAHSIGAVRLRRVCDRAQGVGLRKSLQLPAAATAALTSIVMTTNML